MIDENGRHLLSRMDSGSYRGPTRSVQTRVFLPSPPWLQHRMHLYLLCKSIERDVSKRNTKR